MVSQGINDRANCIRLIHGIEVQVVDTVFKQVFALLYTQLNADLLHLIRLVGKRHHLVLDTLWNSGLAESGKLNYFFDVGNRQNSRQYWDLYTKLPRPVHKII